MKTNVSLSLLFFAVMEALPLSAYSQPSSVEAINSATSSGDSNTLVGWGLVILLLIQLLVIRSISSAIKSIAQSDKIFSSNKSYTNLLLIGSMFFSLQTFAQDVSDSSRPLVTFSDIDIYILISLNMLVSIVVLWMYYQFQQVLKYSGLVKEEEVKSTFWNFEQILTRAVPVEKEASIQFEHEYDGIRELDNVLPPWWLGLFYVTIAFSFIYLIHYHVSPIKALESIGFVGPGVGQEELYRIEMEQAEKEKQAYLAQVASKINEENVTALSDAAEIAQGKEIFMTNCVTCHGKEGQGGAGPNLTDDYWLHGGGIRNIFKTIKYGVPEKGMIAWETQLSPKQIQQVASYILTLRGTNPPGAKEPQGELWKENTSEQTDSLSNTQRDNIQSK